MYSYQIEIDGCLYFADAPSAIGAVLQVLNRLKRRYSDTKFHCRKL